jgi:hypothetical protein
VARRIAALWTLLIGVETDVLEAAVSAWHKLSFCNAQNSFEGN